MGERLNGIQEVRGSIPLASMAWHAGPLDASSEKSIITRNPAATIIQ